MMKMILQLTIFYRIGETEWGETTEDSVWSSWGSH